MGVLFICPVTYLLSRVALAEYVSTWLGESMAARSARNTAMDERPGAEIAGCLFYLLPAAAYSPGLSGKYECTWLGYPWAAPCGCRTAQG